MFRRRPIRRRFRRPLAPGRQAALRRLQKAHQLMAEESYSEAGRIFEDLANAAAKRGIPRAPQLYPKAGDAYLQSGGQTQGVGLLTQGLRLMAKLGQYKRLPAASQRILNELEAQGLKAERETLEQEINDVLDQHGLSLSTATSAKPARLPGKCPQCGGTVHPQEVEWIDDTTSSCVYCGSILEVSS